MDAPLPPEQLAAIRRETLAGNKIQAIKLYREATGKSLSESKHDIETFEVEWRGGAPASASVPSGSGTPTPQQLEPIRAAVLAGNKIQAIKLYREATSLGLAESKRAVEDLEAHWRSAATSPAPAPAAAAKKPDTPFARPAKTGCLSVILLSTAVLSTAAYWLLSR
jgi:ribosomal protein L7/L12